MDDLTYQEQEVLKAMFKMFSQVLETCEYVMIENDTFDRNDLYHLKVKIGVEDDY